LKWNVDASVPGSSGCADIGGVLRDAKGIVLGMFSVPIGVKESNEEELIVVIKALELSSSSSNLTGHSFIIEYNSHGCSIGLLVLVGETTGGGFETLRGDKIQCFISTTRSLQ
jgi:hypothetical protein